MPKHKKPTLKLKRESLRDLSASDLKKVQGGAPVASMEAYCHSMMNY